MAVMSWGLLTDARLWYIMLHGSLQTPNRQQQLAPAGSLIKGIKRQRHAAPRGLASAHQWRTCQGRYSIGSLGRVLQQHSSPLHYPRDNSTTLGCGSDISGTLALTKRSPRWRACPKPQNTHNKQRTMLPLESSRSSHELNDDTDCEHRRRVSLLVGAIRCR
jgi:hypothetical protein